MRIFYNALVLLGLPFVALYWGWRAITEATYRRNFLQRFGFRYPRVDRQRPVIWVHAVSVGEVQASAALVRALQARMPDAQMLITTVTPTGADRVQLLFGDAVRCAYVPYDLMPTVRRFYRKIKPALAIIVETELWPNLYHEAGVQNIPLVLASARISPRSMPRYRRLVGLFRDALSNGIIIAAQSEIDRQRFVELGAPPERTFVSGNIKFDVNVDEDITRRGEAFRREFLGDRPVWIAASTHEGEEAIIVEAHQQLLQTIPDLLLVLVPRHPPRFAEVAQLLERLGCNFVRRTDGQRCTEQTNILLGDTMGEVPMFYAGADIAFVGGSLVRVGGHNLLEPAIAGVPILTGPYLFNAQDIANMFLERDAARVVSNAADLVTSLKALLADDQERAAMGQRAQALMDENRGAVNQLLQQLEPFIDGGRPIAGTNRPTADPG
ncbi:MAG: lipid IV(A) 3-deoxy-D-manno-octulosonic acid transferase [Pseudomonadota bacterium]